MSSCSHNFFSTQDILWPTLENSTHNQSSHCLEDYNGAWTIFCAYQFVDQAPTSLDHFTAQNQKHRGVIISGLISWLIGLVMIRLYTAHVLINCHTTHTNLFGLARIYLMIMIYRQPSTIPHDEDMRGAFISISHQQTIWTASSIYVGQFTFISWERGDVPRKLRKQYRISSFRWYS